MNDYVIGAAAVLTAGPVAGIASATVHAQVDPVLAPTVRAALLDFESATPSELSQVIALASGWTQRRMASDFIAPLASRGECSLAEVMLALARAAGTADLHLFARWLPDEQLADALRRGGVTLIAHSVETIRQAALISGQSYRRWPSPLRAA